MIVSLKRKLKLGECSPATLPWCNTLFTLLGKSSISQDLFSTRKWWDYRILRLCWGQRFFDQQTVPVAQGYQDQDQSIRKGDVVGDRKDW